MRVVQLLSDVLVVLCQREINRKEHFNSVKFLWDVKDWRRPQLATPFFKSRCNMALGFLLSIWVRKKLWLLSILHLSSHSEKFDNFWFYFSLSIFYHFWKMTFCLSCKNKASKGRRGQDKCGSSHDYFLALAMGPGSPLVGFLLFWLCVAQVCWIVSKYLSGGLMLSRFHSIVCHWPSLPVKWGQ